MTRNSLLHSLVYLLGKNIIPFAGSVEMFKEINQTIWEEKWVFQKVFLELIIGGSEGSRVFLLDVSRLALMTSARAELLDLSVKRQLLASISLRVEKCGRPWRHSGWGRHCWLSSASSTLERSL